MTDDRPCTCPPMERPHPCARKFALSECKAATILDPICYRWRHQKDEVWKYGHQPQHLVPPRGKELIGYYIIQSLYTADALEQAREQGRQAGLDQVLRGLRSEDDSTQLRAIIASVEALKAKP